MAAGSRQRYVLRDTAPTVVFWLVTAVGVVLVGDPVLRGDVVGVAATVPIVAFALWVLELVLYHPHIRYNDDELVLTNIGRVHEVPWARVVAVHQNLSLRFELDDGRSLGAFGVAAPRERGLVLAGLSRGKVGAGATHFHQNADAMRHFVGGGTSDDRPVVSRWDVVQLAVGAGLAVAAVIDVVVLLT